MTRRPHDHSPLTRGSHGASTKSQQCQCVCCTHRTGAGPGTTSPAEAVWLHADAAEAHSRWRRVFQVRHLSEHRLGRRVRQLRNAPRRCDITSDGVRIPRRRRRQRGNGVRGVHVCAMRANR